MGGLSLLELSIPPMLKLADVETQSELKLSFESSTTCFLTNIEPRVSFQNAGRTFHCPHPDF